MLYGIRRMPFVNRLFHVYWRFARGMTMGARGMVLDAENRVFLIKHTYADGWQMPGGEEGRRTGRLLGDAFPDLLSGYGF